MVPSAVVPLDHFPLTPNAKIDRNALPAPKEVRRQSAPARSAAPPENALQRSLAGIWSDVLQLDHVGLDDNFFDLGGHSLLAVQLHRRIRAEIDRPLSITDLFRLPTLRALAEFLSGEDGAAKRITSTAKQRASARLAARGQRRRRDSRK
jgi:acyl carrier protein